MPKRYVEKVGDDGLKKAPVGAGPYKFGSSCLSVELVLEAKRAILEKGPQRLVFKAVPDESTRLAMLKRGEADVFYSIRGGKKVKRPRASHHIKPIAQPGSRLERAMKEEARNPNYIKPTLLAPPDDDDDDVVAVQPSEKSTTTKKPFFDLTTPLGRARSQEWDDQHPDVQSSKEEQE